MRKILSVLIGAALVFSGCSKQGGAGTSGTGASGGVLRVANYAEPTSLNPLLITNTAENFIASLVFDELVTLDDRGNEIPDLAAEVPSAKNGGVSRDGMTVTYRLRRNVKWQDGSPFTSDDVKFSWQAVMNPNNNVVERRGYDQVRSVDTPDPHTVVFHLKQPFAPFVDTVFGESDDPYRIVPKHILGKYADINKVPFNQQPIGTGPFKVARWIHGEKVDLVANPEYFRGRPKLAGIEVQTVPDGNTASAMIRSHGTDLIVDVSASNYHLLKDVTGVSVLLVKSPSYSSIVFNMTHPPLDDVRVRQALSYAVNKQRIVNDLEYGTAVEATSDLADFYWAYDPDVARYDYDRQKAEALLDEAGWTRGPGGMRFKNGKPLSLQMVYGQGSETARQIGVQVQADLHGVGIDVPIKTYTYTMLYATLQEGGILNTGKFDLALWSWVAGADPDDSSQWMCAMTPPNGNNNGHYCNPKVDAAEKVALTNFDRSVRKKAYSTIQKTLAQDAAADFLFYSRRRYAMNPNLSNFKPNGPSEGWNAFEWNL